jgi:hypothetical protein
MSDLRALQEAYIGLIRAVRALADCPELAAQRLMASALAAAVGSHIVAKRREGVPHARTAG